MNKMYQKFKELGNEVENLRVLGENLVTDDRVIIETREKIDQLQLEIQNINNEREKSSELKAIYFPYSRILDRYALRKAVFLFDKILFLDPLEQEMRSVVLEYRNGKNGYLPFKRLSEAWKENQEIYFLLAEEDQIDFYDTYQIAQDFEPIIGNQLLSDIEDLSLQSNFPDRTNTWAILREDFPWETVKDRINIQDKFHLYPNYNSVGVDAPLIHGQVNLTWNTRFLFVDPLQGASIKLSQAMIVSSFENIPLFTDKSLYVELLSKRTGFSAKYPYKTKILKSDEPMQLRARLAFAILDKFIQHEPGFANLPMRKIIEYKRNCQETRIRFNEKIVELCHEIQESSLTDENKIVSFIERHISPEVTKYEDDIKNVYDGMFKGLVDVGSKAIITGLSGAALSGVVFQNITYSEILSMGVGLATMALIPSMPVMVELLVERRKIKRNSFIYLLDMPKTEQY